MKYRHKLTILLVTASLVPMILLVLYSHDRMSSLLREKEMEDMSSILEQTGEGIDSQIEVFSSLGILIYFGNVFQPNTFFLFLHDYNPPLVIQQIYRVVLLTPKCLIIQFMISTAP